MWEQEERHGKASRSHWEGDISARTLRRERGEPRVYLREELSRQRKQPVQRPWGGSKRPSWSGGPAQVVRGWGQELTRAWFCDPRKASRRLPCLYDLASITSCSSEASRQVPYAQGKGPKLHLLKAECPRMRGHILKPPHRVWEFEAK